MRIKSRSKRVFTASPLSSSSSSGEEIAIKKGPWKAYEDEVLLKHVSKYGPRDWSFLLSKGLLRRNGKSCRLRWTNKLRPNLKNGCKFSAEEERIVIDLQAQLGNKWAKISTYLPGRTDNDVKNFWSSCQKRLARLLHNSPKSKSNKSLSSKGIVESSSNADSSNSLHFTPLAMEVAPIGPIQAIQPRNEECELLPFPDPPLDLPLLDFDFLGAFGRPQDAIPSGVDISEEVDDHGLMQMSSEMVDFLGPIHDSRFGDRKMDGGRGGLGSGIGFDPNSMTPDRFFDDLPSDIFDQMEQIPSPPSLDW